MPTAEHHETKNLLQHPLLNCTNRGLRSESARVRVVKWRVDVSEYVKHDAVGLAELVRHGDATPGELVDVALGLIDKLNPELNAVIVQRNESVRHEAIDPPNGPFTGVPFLVKDMDGVLANEPNTSSSRSLVDWRPKTDSELFARYKSAGLMIVGKTNTPEFGIMGVTESELRGPCRNPWNLNHTPGGSSGGSAASVAARIVPVAHAGDGGGSIRIPASACGIFGLKPTRGRQPLGPYIGEGWDGLCVPNVVSRTVRDSAALLDITRGSDLGAPYAEPHGPKSFLLDSLRRPGKLRIGYSTQALLGTDSDPDAGAAVHDAVILLRSLGHELIEIDLPLDKEAIVKAYLTIVAANVACDIADTKEHTGKAPSADMFELPTWFLGQVANELSATEHLQARATCQHLGRSMAQLFADKKIDLHLTATMAYPPVEVGELALSPIEHITLSTLRRASSGRLLRIVLGQLAANSLDKTPNTQVWNMTGQPAMNVPLWWNQANLPVGVQFAGKFGDESTLLRLATQLEEARPWADRIPPVAAS